MQHESFAQTCRRDRSLWYSDALSRAVLLSSMLPGLKLQDCLEARPMLLCLCLQPDRAGLQQQHHTDQQGLCCMRGSADTVTATLQACSREKSAGVNVVHAFLGTHHSPLQVRPLKVCCLGGPCALQWSVVVGIKL